MAGRPLTQDIAELSEPNEDDPPRNHLQFRKRGADLIETGSPTPPTIADILCAYYGDDYIRRCSLVFSRCYRQIWNITRGRSPVPRWLLQSISDTALSPKATSDFVYFERQRFEARLARRLELRKFAGRWAGLFLSGAYDLPISTLPKKTKSRRKKS